MRKLAKMLVLSTLFVVSVGMFSRLAAESVSSGQGGILASLADVGRLIRNLQPPAQSPTAAAKTGKFVATIETDQEDYAPNTQVTITGSNFLPRELVELKIEEIA